MKKFQNTVYEPINGVIALVFYFLIVVLTAGYFLFTPRISGIEAFFVIFFGFILFLGLKGFTVVNPNESVLLMFLGAYQGTVSDAGFWYYPFWYSGSRVSTKIYSHETGSIKVNDKAGNPIEIGAVILWKVENVAQALLGVDNYLAIIKQQAESALRTIAAKYRYDHVDTDDAHTQEITLRDGQDVVSKELSKEVLARVEIAGLEIYEARITSLAYAPEIASAMLQRQHAEATLAARQKLIDGVVKIVHGAIEKLSKPQEGSLDIALEMTPEKKAEMAANLMIVLASEKGAQPVINVSHRSIN